MQPRCVVAHTGSEKFTRAPALQGSSAWSFTDSEPVSGRRDRAYEQLSPYRAVLRLPVGRYFLENRNTPVLDAEVTPLGQVMHDAAHHLP